MFPKTRQEKLNPVLEALNSMEGIHSVTPDDFDSVGINVFFYLRDKGGKKARRDKIYAFEVSVQAIKIRLKRIFKELGVDYRVIDYPVRETEYVPVHMREPGDPAKRFIGYDSSRFGIEVSV